MITTAAIQNKLMVNKKIHNTSAPTKQKLTRSKSRRKNKVKKSEKGSVLCTEGKTLRRPKEELLGPNNYGLVIAHYGNQVDVIDVNKPEITFRCHLGTDLPPTVTGDRIIWRLYNNESLRIVVSIEKRNSLFSRPDLKGQLKPVAANVDYIILVIALAPLPHTELIDRYLVAAETIGIKPVLLVNKTDLLNNKSKLQLITEIVNIYERIDYLVLKTSTKTHDGINDVKKLLNKHTCVFVGQSGVGKSSLINALLPDVNTKVGVLAEKNYQGAHTTSVTRLFLIPSGGQIIDSPGVREFGLWHMEPGDILHGFKEFRPFIGRCKFRNCNHNQEPDCAIQKAVKEGAIVQQRLDNYQNILNSMKKE